MSQLRFQTVSYTMIGSTSYSNAIHIDEEAHPIHSRSFTLLGMSRNCWEVRWFGSIPHQQSQTSAFLKQSKCVELKRTPGTNRVFAERVYFWSLRQTPISGERAQFLLLSLLSLSQSRRLRFPNPPDTRPRSGLTFMVLAFCGPFTKQLGVFLFLQV